MYAMTPWVRRLIIANVVMFLLSFPPGASLLPTLFNEFSLRPALLLTRPWTGFTYMFLHGGLGHIAFNMLALFFFGPRIERKLGGADFMKLYLLSGFGGAAFSFFFAPMNPVVGASGAVFGVLLAFAMFWPHERIYIWGILPVPAWLLITFSVIFSLWSGITGAGGNTAHFAHLGGLAFGFGVLKWLDWRRGAAKRDFQQRMQGPGAAAPTMLSERSLMERWQKIDLAALHEINRAEVELLLAKARLLGPRGLSDGERALLDRMAAASGR